ncbi:MAG TPA: PAS domain S-box protein [Burkholderiales bacterium]
MSKAKQASPQASMIDFVESLPLPVFVKGRDGRYVAVNQAWEEFFGISREDFLGKKVADLYPQNPAVSALHGAKDMELWARPGGQRYETPITTFAGEQRDTIYYKATFRGEGGEADGLVGVIVDITARKRAEARLRDGEERFRAVVDSANEGILVYDRALNIIAGNQAAERIIGLPLVDIIGAAGFTSLLPCVHADGRPLGEKDRPTRVTLRSGEGLTGYIVGIQRPGGSLTWLSVNTAFLRRPGETDWYGIVSTIGDITAQRNAEMALRESEARFRQTFELAAAGIAHVVDGRFTRVNRSLCEILGRSEAQLIGTSVKEVSHPEDRDVSDPIRRRLVAGEAESVRFEKRYLRPDSAVVWAEVVIALVRNDAAAPLYEIAIFHDITERKRAAVALAEAHDELKRSNAELEQFAYVASHDLQEPLRMVSSYTQLVQRRYGDRFDGDAKEFMGFVIEGAARMKQLIEDLLAYSRVGTRGKEFLPIEVEPSLNKAISNLRSAVEESSAAVTWDPLPRVSADESQLAQLFQNLVGNALKFRSASVPRIHVACIEKEADFEFAVSDNGIGIEPQYFERIFMVFQRLHNKAEYPGTGIGLAICKKVVERHGGRIWVTSKAGAGSTFHFTLPKGREKEHG